MFKLYLIVAFGSGAVNPVHVGDYETKERCLKAATSADGRHLAGAGKTPETPFVGSATIQYICIPNNDAVTKLP